MPVFKFSVIEMKAVKTKIKLSAVCLILATLTACSATKDNELKVLAQSNPVASNVNETINESTPTVSPAEAVKVRAVEANVRIGESAIAEIEVLIAEGFHVNANPASFSYLQPTELKIEKIKGLTIGEPIYPKAESKKFSFSEEPIAVYENAIAFKVPVRVSKNAKPRQTVLRGLVQAQPCNDSACFPSRTIEFSLSVQITR
jgi:hypothetical protein